MIKLVNKDMSFFEITSDDINLKTTDFSKNTISLTITERMDGLPQGSISFYDPDYTIAKILRSWVKINIAWGYKNFVPDSDTALTHSINPDEITGDLIRRGLEVMISDPSGGGGNDGVIKYNCNFTSFQWRGSKASKKYESGNKTGVIIDAFTDLGVGSKRYINFRRGNEFVNSDRAVFQDETTYAFLNRIAREWGCIFSIGWTPEKEVIGIFIDPDKLGDENYPKWAFDAVGSSHLIGYKGRINNVKSYTWERSESEAGMGDMVIPMMVNGQIVYNRYLADQQKVSTWRLDPEKVSAAFGERASGGPEAQSKLAVELLSRPDFESVKGFFTQVEETTAPQGFGYRVKAEMMGNPLFSPKNIVKFNNGFPEFIGSTDTKWYLNEVTHTIDTNGYMMNIEVVDAYTLSPTGNPII